MHLELARSFFNSRSLIFGKSKAFLLNKKDNFDLTEPKLMLKMISN